MDTKCFIMSARNGLFAHNIKNWLADLFNKQFFFSVPAWFMHCAKYYRDKLDLIVEAYST